MVYSKSKLALICYLALSSFTGMSVAIAEVSGTGPRIPMSCTPEEFENRQIQVDMGLSDGECEVVMEELFQRYKQGQYWINRYLNQEEQARSNKDLYVGAGLLFSGDWIRRNVINPNLLEAAAAEKILSVQQSYMLRKIYDMIRAVTLLDLEKVPTETVLDTIEESIAATENFKVQQKAVLKATENSRRGLIPINLKEIDAIINDLKMLRLKLPNPNREWVIREVSKLQASLIKQGDNLVQKNWSLKNSRFLNPKEMVDLRGQKSFVGWMQGIGAFLILHSLFESAKDTAMPHTLYQLISQELGLGDGQLEPSLLVKDRYPQELACWHLNRYPKLKRKFQESLARDVVCVSNQFIVPANSPSRGFIANQVPSSSDVAIDSETSAELSSPPKDFERGRYQRGRLPRSPLFPPESNAAETLENLEN